TWPQGTWVACTRYGNVLDSRGSVLSVWRDAVAAGKPLPVTHPDMTRFVLTVKQAVDVVLHALDTMTGGEVFLPRLRAFRLLALAVAAHPGHPIELVGLRPGGEKLHERLISDEEEGRTYWHDGYYEVLPARRSWHSRPYAGSLATFAAAYTSDRAT